MCHLKPMLFYWFSLSDLSIAISCVLKSLIIIALLSISPFLFISICFMYWDPPMLGGLVFPSKNFPQFIVIHTVKGFGVINKAKANVCFQKNFLLFQWSNGCWQFDLFSKTSLNIWKFMVHILLRPAWRILSITLLACKMSMIVQ